MDGLFEKSPQRSPGRAVPAAAYVHVAVERGIERGGGGGGEKGGGGTIDGTLTYSSDDATIQVGERVRVPLGRGDKLTDGVVVAVGGTELLGEYPASKVKPMAGRTGGSLTPELVDLGRWISSYYICPLGMVLATMLPAAVKKGTGGRDVVYVEPAADGVIAEHATNLKKAGAKAWAAVAALDPAIFPLTLKELAAAAAISIAAVRKLLAIGLLVQQARREVHAAELAGSGADSQEMPGGHRSASAGRINRFTLTDEQHAAVESISASLGSFGVHLIRGVTGSGKTEVYLRVIETVLARGQRAIVLVPEIALTPQTSRRFLDRFGPGRVAVLHSGLSASQRHSQWSKAAAGTVDVVVGARSAIFAPLDSLGLIVVDEEHDSSYKQDQLPRYHARDVAVKRAQQLGCTVVLGSATPSLESYANAGGGAAAQAAPRASAGTTQPGEAASGLRLVGGAASVPAPAAKYTLHTLRNRATGAPMPKVEIVDLALERKLRAKDGGWRDSHLHLLGPTLERALGETLRRGGQAMLLLNRRGYANYIACPDQRCGWVKHCDDCDATMVYHLMFDRESGSSREAGFVRCHHCLAEHLLPRTCPVCSKKINTFGLGTQRVEEELERKLALTHGLRSSPGPAGEPVTMLRVDSDTMSTARDYFDALDRFARGEVKLLLGTQMIAKGLDFPNVQLVGVINADTALNLPDFRATERTFQLVSQVAGRAGREKSGDGAGRVIVQTMEPQAPSIRLAASHDYEKFAAIELAVRARAGLPPSGRMARIVCRDEDHIKAEAAATQVRALLDTAGAELGTKAGRLMIRGPMPCPISRIARHYRFAVELVAQSRGVVQALLGALREKGMLKSDAHTAVDVDPVAML